MKGLPQKEKKGTRKDRGAVTGTGVEESDVRAVRNANI